VLALTMALSSLWLPGSATADSIDDKKAQAAQLATRLEDLRTKAEQLSEDLNDSQVQLDQLNVRIAEVTAQLAANQAAATKVQSRLDGWVLQAYVNASSSDDVFSVLDPAVTLDNAASLQGYLKLAVGDDASAADELAANGEDTIRLQGELDQQLADQNDLQQRIESKRAQVTSAVGETERLLDQTNGELADLVAAEADRRAAAEAAAAQAAAEQQAASDRAARAAAQRVAPANPVPADDGNSPGPGPAPAPSPGDGGSDATPAPVYIPPPPPSSPGAAGAVEAALSVLGTRYRWAGDSPSEGFDCSGLIVWAYRQVGRSLPHSSRALYSQLPKVSMDEIQPGDLIFFGRPIHHVGMYIGNGQMVHSPQTGDVVKISSIYRKDTVGIARP
jgi:peptidoglycan DL-endopeptidase CwlO